MPSPSRAVIAAAAQLLASASGLEVLECVPGFARARQRLRAHQVRRDGVLARATLVGLAETVCGYASTRVPGECAAVHASTCVRARDMSSPRPAGVTCIAIARSLTPAAQEWEVYITDEGSRRALASLTCTLVNASAPVRSGRLARLAALLAGR